MLGLPGFLGIVVIWSLFYAWFYRRRAQNQGRHRDVLAVGVLILATLAFYWPLFFTESWIPKGGGDLSSFIYPIYAFAARWLKRGIIPLWNPHLYLGMPFAADNQSGLFYPLNLLFFLLIPRFTYPVVELMAVIHVFLAGLFSYRLLRDLPSWRTTGSDPDRSGARPPIGRLPALAGAIAFMFSDLFVVHPGNLNIIATAAWLPLVLFCFRRALARPGWGWTGWSGLVLGIAALVGHAQMFLYIGMSLALLTFFEVVRDRHAGWRPALRRLAVLVLTGAIAFGLSALALIPAYDLTDYTVRSSMSYQDASNFYVPPAGLIGILMPGFWGRGTGPFWGPWSRTEMGYVGVLPLLLAAVAVVMAWRQPWVRFWLLLGTIGLLTALGPYTALHGWTYALIPFFRQLRVPARAIFLFDLAVAMLAAGGLDLLLHPLSRLARRLLARFERGLVWIGGVLALFVLPLLGHAVISARMAVPSDVLAQHVTSMNSVVFLLLFLGLSAAGLALRRRGQRSTLVLGVGAVLVIAFDLISLGAYVEIEPNDPLAGYRHDEALAFLRADGDVYRVETTADVHGGWAPDWALIHEMDDLNGIWNPLRLGAYDVLTWVGIDRENPFYRLYNVKYLITGRNIPVPASFEPVFDEGEHIMYRFKDVLPRAFMVYEVVPASGDIHALQIAKSSDFDPAAQIVLKQQDNPVLLAAPPDLGESQVEIVGRGPNHINLRVETPADGYLFISEMWMPGWLATVDGQSRPVLQANYTFRAVYVRAGESQVHLRYRPLPWLVGLGITLGTMAVLAAWAGWSLLRKRRPFRPAPAKKWSAWRR